LVCCGLDLKGLKARLVELAGELGIDRHVSLLDSRSDVDTIYSGLDVYVQPSDAEGFSIALLEAMSHALPIVATAVGGNPEAIVNGSSGLLVAPQDVSAVAGAISVLLEDSQQSRSLGLAAFERVKNCFPLAGMVEAHKRLYEELRPLRGG
jgi:glycosyltransferase involved in cell wall biosynthesis